MAGPSSDAAGGAAAVDGALLDALTHHVDEAVVAFDADGVITWASPSTRALLGHDPPALVGQNVLDLVHDDDVAGLPEALVRWSGRPGAPRGEVLRIRAAAGGWVPLRYDAVTGPSVTSLGACVVTLRPDGEASSAAAELRARDELDRRLVRLASTFLDRGARPFAAALDAAVADLAGLEWVTRMSVWRTEGDRATCRAQWVAAANAPTRPLPRSLALDGSVGLRRLAAGHEVHLRSTRHLPDDWEVDRDVLLGAGVRSLLAVPFLVGERVTGFVVAEVTLDEVGFDATHLTTLRSAAAIIAAAYEREEVERELDRRARTDALTGLGNRFAFDEALDDALAELAAGRTAGVGVAIVDLDRFKLVNDALGHLAGDRLLADVIARLADATPAGTTVARLGGDELLVLHRDVVDAAEAAGRTDAMLATLTAPFDVDGRPFVLTASGGVAHAVDADVGAVELLRRADVAMYQAKAAGGAHVVVADEVLQAEVGHRLHRETELRTAIDRGDVIAHVQGEFDLATGELVGGEALARWQHHDGELVAAGEFIPLAEECGLVGALGVQVLRQAVRALARWRADGVADGFVLRVNLSAHQLVDDAIVGIVADELAAAPLPPSQLCLELTESAILTDPDRAVRTLTALRELGVGLAVDDFGTGYSSMLYLKRLPITALKIDQAFVAGLPDDPGDAAIVQAVLQLADLLGLTVTAEGVETAAQRDRLVELGCRYAQGFLLGRPESLGDFEQRLAV